MTVGAYFDCSFGAAGDMLLASLIACGADPGYIESELKKLPLKDEFELCVEDVVRCTIQAKKIEVKCFIDGGTNGGKKHGRTFSAIKSIIDSSELSEQDKNLANSIFENLAISEARVHGKTVEKVHFHEVGALDAIVDIVGFAVAYNSLKIEQSSVSALPLGSGVVKTEHGIFPVPAPCVGYLIQDAKAPVSSLNIPFECLTPTGAAILTTIASQFGAMPEFSEVTSIGYGAGTLDPFDHPNVSRIMVGCLQDSNNGSLSRESGKVEARIVAVIEANIDDLAPDLISFSQEKLLKEGALDVTVTATTMKKGRSGHLITILCEPAHKAHLERVLFEETSTIGSRSYFVERQVLERRLVSVSLPDKTRVDVKVAFDQKGSVMNVSPEYKHCRDYAKRNNIPLKEVYELARDCYKKSTDSKFSF